MKKSPVLGDFFMRLKWRVKVLILNIFEASIIISAEKINFQTIPNLVFY